MFSYQQIDPPCAHVSPCTNATLPDVLYFGLCPVLQFFLSLVRHVSSLTSSSVSCLFLNVIGELHGVLQNAYVLDKCDRATVHLLSLSMSRFLCRRHDFAALLRKTARKRLYLPLSVLYRLVASQRLRPATCGHLSLPLSVLYRLSRCFVSQRLRPATCGHLSKCRYDFGRRRPILKFHISKLSNHECLPSLFSPTVPLSTARHIGGGSSVLTWASIQPYVISKPSTFNDQSNLSYIAYVNKMGLKQYPNDKFVFAEIPLPVISQLLNIPFARYTATMHGISVGTRCTVAQLKHVDCHNCLNCPSYTTVFSVTDNSSTKNANRVRKHREKMAQTAMPTPIHSGNAGTSPKTTEFPPPPCSVDLQHTIIKDACKRMNPVNFRLCRM